jgi:hypothetical protein
VSFAKTSEHLDAMLAVRIAAETVRSLVESRGKAMAAFQPKDEATAQAFGRAKGEVELAVDAGKVNTREQGWKDLKIAVISKREAGEPVTPQRWQEDRLPKATAVVSSAMIAPSKVFCKTWGPSLRRLGVSEFARVQVLGDGVFGTTMIAAVALQHARFSRGLAEGDMPLRCWSTLGIWVSAFMAAMGVVLAVYLLCSVPVG